MHGAGRDKCRQLNRDLFIIVERYLLYAEHFHHFVAQVVDDLHGDAAGFGFVQRAGYVAAEGGPGFFVDLGFERRLERLVGIIRAQEVGVADEEALFVVVGVDEPAGDAIGAVADHFAGLGFENVHTVLSIK